MTATQTVFQPITITDFSESYNEMHLVTALQSEVAKLQAKIISYYQEEITLRGDKVLMREYRGHFGIEP